MEATPPPHAGEGKINRPVTKSAQIQWAVPLKCPFDFPTAFVERFIFPR